MKSVVKEDLEALSLGCAFLGSGGGGNPAYDRLIAEHAIETYGDVQIITIEELSDEAMVVPMAFVGAPLIAMEKLSSGTEFDAILRHLNRQDIVLMPAEIGGANGLCCLAVAAKWGLPVLDADSLGRAYPQLQMTSCNLFGVSPSPAYFADSLGNLVVIEAESPYALERIGRHVSMSMGSSCAVALYLMNGKEAREAVIPGALSNALSIGRAILEGRSQGVSLIQGVITEVSQAVVEGFLQGSVKINGEQKVVEVLYQNEFLIAREGEEVLATTPDILTIVELESGTPITSDALRYGLRVALLALPAPAIWKTTEGLALVGPKVFGYNVEYKEIRNEIHNRN
ncbi:MAG: DUF917 domain-containing protein [Verrucomicrobia bacterium]|nr:DUF917 domain-containing protein [Verrucomicrobiota bacterium]